MGGRKLALACKSIYIRIQSRWHESNNMFEQYSVERAIMPAISGVPPCMDRQNMAAP